MSKGVLMGGDRDGDVGVGSGDNIGENLDSDDGSYSGDDGGVNNVGDDSGDDGGARTEVVLHALLQLHDGFADGHQTVSGDAE